MVTLPMAAAERRDGPGEIARQRRLVEQECAVAGGLDRLPIAAAIINAGRQVVAANPPFVRLLGLTDLGAVIGARFGEAAGCAHAAETAEGCGTTLACANCGALRAQRRALNGEDACEECRISTRVAGRDLDLRVWGRPVTIASEPFAVLTLLDIRDEKRRRALERTFFHDILNTAGGILGVVTLFEGADGTEQEDLRALLGRLSEALVEEIEAQRDLLEIERGEFTPGLRSVSAADLLRQTVEAYAHHPVAAGRDLRSVAPPGDVALVTDPRLLRRVLGNLTKNALEATLQGGVVTLAATGDDDHITFLVHNAATMPAAVRLQVFQRSYSTKGTGRGLGTYSAKLITEGYLRGTLSFTSDSDTGTTFSVRVPVR